MVIFSVKMLYCIFTKGVFLGKMFIYLAGIGYIFGRKLCYFGVMFLKRGIFWFRYLLDVLFGPL